MGHLPVAVMMMVEEGKVRLNDPVSRFIPEFKQASIAVPKGGPATAAQGGRAGGGWSFFVVERPALAYPAPGSQDAGEAVELFLYCDG